MTAAKNKRNTGIELLRIIACFMVILAHIRPMLMLDDGKIADGALIIQTFLAPGVGLFFLITGCFIPKSPVLKAWKRFIFSVALPTLIFVFCVDLLENWLDSSCGIIHSLRQADIYNIISNIFNGILSFDAGKLGKLNGHIWFVFSYALIMLWLPLLHALVKADAKKPLVFFAALSILKLLIIDINRLWPFSIQLFLPELPPYEILYAAVGYLIYEYISKKNTDAINDKKRLKISLMYVILTVALMAVTYILQRMLFVKQLGDGLSPSDIRLTAYYMNWLSGFSVILSMLIMAAVLWLPKLSGIFEKITLKAGCVSFPVFLLHFPLVHKLRTIGLEEKVMQLLGAEHGIGAIIYSLCYAAFIFIISALLFELFHLAYSAFKSILSRR